MTASVLKQDSKNEKVQTNAYLFWHGHSMHIFGEIPFVKNEVLRGTRSEKRNIVISDP